MADFNRNIWAPWRMEYIRSLGEEEADDGCFLCRYWEQPDRDQENRVLWRTESTFVVMNRFPYTNGHLLIAHARHKGDVADLDDAELTEMTRAIRDATGVLRATLSPHGFNIGYNLGRCGSGPSRTSARPHRPAMVGRHELHGRHRRQPRRPGFTRRSVGQAGQEC